MGRKGGGKTSSSRELIEQGLIEASGRGRERSFILGVKIYRENKDINYEIDLKEEKIVIKYNNYMFDKKIKIINKNVDNFSISVKYLLVDENIINFYEIK